MKLCVAVFRMLTFRGVKDGCSPASEDIPDTLIRKWAPEVTSLLAIRCETDKIDAPVPDTVPSQSLSLMHALSGRELCEQMQCLNAI